jgi:hypothetical protein
VRLYTSALHGWETRRRQRLVVEGIQQTLDHIRGEYMLSYMLCSMFIMLQAVHFDILF